ncbi:uncharacterized protein V2V93DRAFT_374470 [Kockiozyma suomiensis]|uniref:uncharacterized protein n=1 Tax=Kockiozyma suomiensis TaxID=1337062 RepID=UPI003343A352
MRKSRSTAALPDAINNIDSAPQMLAVQHMPQLPQPQALPPQATSSATSSTSGTNSAQELPRPYKCPMCDKAFHRLEHQTRHIRTHTGEKPHACAFPGCHKRFSRSDELTRHSRIHTNANPRRSYKAASEVKSAPASNVSSPQPSPPHAHASLHQAAPGVQTSTAPIVQNQSAPSSIGLAPISSAQPVANAQPVASTGASAATAAAGPGGLPFDMHMLATAASQQLERENSVHSAHSRSSLSILSTASVSPQQHLPPPHLSAPASNSSSPSGLHHHHHHHHHHRFPGLAPLTPYNASHGMTRHAVDDDLFGPRQSKRSRPNSPASTAPSSPTFSLSDSPTPEHTPLVTPAHSPRLHPRELEALQGVQLPSIRSLSLRHMPPPLVPLEVPDIGSNATTPGGSASVSRSTSSSNLRLLPISDILSSSQPPQPPQPSSNSNSPGDISKRILPHPTSAPQLGITTLPSMQTSQSSMQQSRLGIADLIHASGAGFESNGSSNASSVSGDENNMRWQ